MLDEINLASNELTHLPMNTFQSNINPKGIDLSQNKLSQISFGIAHLKHLKLLDLRNNVTEYLERFSRTTLDKLFRFQNQGNSTQKNRRLLVDLRGNHFSCDCDALDFLQRFASSPTF